MKRPWKGKRALSKFSTPEQSMGGGIIGETSNLCREEKGYDAATPVRIYYDGVFDLFHFGHARALEQAKKLRPFTYLIVGVCNDELTHSLKGKTVMNEAERYECVRHCKWVDEIIEGAPWIITNEFLDAHGVGRMLTLDRLCSPGRHPISSRRRHYRHLRKHQGPGKVSSNQKDRGYPEASSLGISTSDLITRIVRDYDVYLRRNLERGVSPSDLNISFFKEREIILKRYLARIGAMLKGSRRTIERNWKGTQLELLDALDGWEKRSHNLIQRFAKKYSGAMSRLFGPKLGDSVSTIKAEEK